MGAGNSKERMLYDSVRRGDIHSIRSLHSQGASLNWMSFSGKTALILACSTVDRLQIAKTILELGADVNYYHPEGTVGTALHRAAHRGLEQTVILLLSHGANPLLRNVQGYNALDSARRGGHTGIVRAIENKICFFSGWLRHISAARPQNQSARRVWAAVLPGDSALARNVSDLKIALYCDRQSPRPFNVVSLKKFYVQQPDFLFPDPELVLSNKFSGMKLKLLSGEEGDSEQLKLLYDSCRGKIKTNEPSSEAVAGATPPRWPHSSPMAASAPLTVREEADIAMAIVASIQSAVEEGIPLSEVNFGRPEEVKSCENTLPATVTENRAPSAGEGTSGLSSSCVICNEAPAEAACVPCGHLAGCMACLTEVKMKDFGCPICRARIERIMKIYSV